MIEKNVLVKPILEQVTEAGIVLKTDFQPKTLKGEVIALADHPECSELKVGDTVYYDYLFPLMDYYSYTLELTVVFYLKLL